MQEETWELVKAGTIGIAIHPYTPPPDESKETIHLTQHGPIIESDSHYVPVRLGNYVQPLEKVPFRSLV